MFDYECDESWFMSDFAKRAVKDIDKSDLIGPHLVQSPILGAIPPKELSGGVKSVIMAYEQPTLRKYSSILYGDNCTKWLLEAATDRDITIVLEHFLGFPSGNDYKLYFEDIDEIAHGYRDYLHLAIARNTDPWGGDFPVEDIKVKSRFDEQQGRRG
jgi:hypothetical protein